MTTKSKKLIPSFLLLVLFVAVCFRLGLWQWDRAAQFNERQQEQARIELSQIAQPGSNLDPSAYGRLVKSDGRYLQSWLVPQRTVGERTGTWQAALLQTSAGGVLVVRSWNESPLPAGEVSIEGRLYPAQNPETSAPALDGYLSRVDPSLIVNQVSLPLIDGYVILSNEMPTSSLDLVDSPLPQRNPPGFYWQHLSYVILWWFFGLLAIVVWVRSARESRQR